MRNQAASRRVRFYFLGKHLMNTSQGCSKTWRLICCGGQRFSPASFWVNKLAATISIPIHKQLKVSHLSRRRPLMTVKISMDGIKIILWLVPCIATIGPRKNGSDWLWCVIKSEGTCQAKWLTCRLHKVTVNRGILGQVVSGSSHMLGFFGSNRGTIGGSMWKSPGWSTAATLYSWRRTLAFWASVVAAMVSPWPNNKETCLAAAWQPHLLGSYLDDHKQRSSPQKHWSKERREGTHSNFSTTWREANSTVASAKRCHKSWWASCGLTICIQSAADMKLGILHNPLAVTDQSHTVSLHFKTADPKMEETLNRTHNCQYLCTVGPLVETKHRRGICVKPCGGTWFCEVPSGKHTKNYWTWPIEIVDLPIKHGDVP